MGGSSGEHQAEGRAVNAEEKRRFNEVVERNRAARATGNVGAFLPPAPGSASGKWPLPIDVNGYPPPLLTEEMRRVLSLLARSHANSDSCLRAPYWATAARHRAPLRCTLTALCRRGLAQWIKINDQQGFWRISAVGRRFTVR